MFSYRNLITSFQIVFKTFSLCYEFRTKSHGARPTYERYIEPSDPSRRIIAQNTSNGQSIATMRDLCRQELSLKWAHSHLSQASGPMRLTPQTQRAREVSTVNYFMLEEGRLSASQGMITHASIQDSAASDGFVIQAIDLKQIVSSTRVCSICTYDIFRHLVSINKTAI